MADRNQSVSLRERVDALAVRLVVAGEQDTAAQCLAEVEAIRALAAQQGKHALSQAAAELAAAASAAPDPAAALSDGLVRLQQALDAAESQAAPAAPPAKATAALGDDPELIADFVVEAREHLDTIEARLLALEKDAGDPEAIHSIFRSFHTIKGLAGFLGLDRVQAVSHEVETLLDLARQSLLEITPETTDVILASMDYLRQWVKHLEGGTAAGAPETLLRHEQLIERVQSARAPRPESPPEGIAPNQPAPAPETENIRKAVPDLVPKATAVPSAPFVEPQPSAPAAPPPVQHAVPTASTEPAKTVAPAQRSAGRLVRVDTEKLDFLVDMVGELVIAQSLVSYDPDLQANNKPRLARNLSQLARITGEVQRTAMAMRMVEIGTLFQKMARLVRDLSRKFGKTVTFETDGDQVEVDRQIVEDLADPVMHMVRNAIDHGVETAQRRVAAGKDPAARVWLRAFHNSGQIVIELGDDGNGLNRARILEKAQQKGIIGPNANLTDNECYNLIFQPGFSTAAEVSDVSGRGVGMDVVRKQIAKLRGSIEIHSVPGQGTTFLLKLPLTLAIIEGLVVGLGSDTFIIPIFTVRELLRPNAAMISSIEGNQEMVMVRETLLPLVRLHQRFGIEPKSRAADDGVLVVAEANGKAFALLVDELIGKREVVIKSLGPTFRHIAGIAGGAILGDGHVGLILDMPSLFEGRVR